MAVPTLQKKSAIKERILLALEAKKRAKWLRQIEVMPEIRPEQMESVTNSSTLSLEEQLIKAANNILETGF